ncbi:Sm-like protein LSM8 [Bienertia sinuspersici]
MVISWILGSVFESIKKSVMFMNNACEIWRHLENRYSITNGAKKYALNKQIYETKQNGRLVSNYYTSMKAIWVELETLNVLPTITNMSVEINRFILAFLNGLGFDEACNIVQQEESQRELFKQEKHEGDVRAMHTKRSEMTGKIGHLTEKCWSCKACGKPDIPWNNAGP